MAWRKMKEWKNIWENVDRKVYKKKNQGCKKTIRRGMWMKQKKKREQKIKYKRKKTIF